MPVYISELDYYGNSDAEFIEIAAPAGTDVSGYSVVIYDNNGYVAGTYELGAVQNTMAGQDVYVVDDATPGYATTDSGGRLYLDYGVALVDDSGNVLQFVSYWGDTVTALDGPAVKLTSVDIGTSSSTGSLISEDGGATYTAIESPTKGTIPACYAPGMMIATGAGPCPVEDLRVGDIVVSPDAARHKIRWVWSGVQTFANLRPDQKPVLISRGALGANRPGRDLIVSAQHRIVVGVADQLPGISPHPCLVPAKALTPLPGIRHMTGKQSIRWHHFACDSHVVVLANGVKTESLLPGAMVLMGLAGHHGRKLYRALDLDDGGHGRPAPALACLRAGEISQAVKTWQTAALSAHRCSMLERIAAN